MIYLLYLRLILLVGLTIACNKKEPLPDDLDFQALIQPVRGSRTIGQGNCGLNSANVLDAPDYFTWGGSVVEGDDGKFHMFYAHWAAGHEGRKNTKLDSIFDGMKGWLKYSEIAYAVSDSAAGPFYPVSTVLKGTGNEKDWDQFTAHNPHIKKFGDKYYLYYIGTNPQEDFNLENSEDEKRQHWYRYATGQRIGVIVASSIEELVSGKGQRSTQPIMVPDQKNTFWVATNPSVTEGPDGTFYLMFKSWNLKRTHMTHWIATGPTATGPFELQGPVLQDADLSAEDPFLWYDKLRERFYAVVKDFSGSGKLSPQFGALALITSKDGLNDWQPARYPLISLRQLETMDGTIVQLVHLERPQLLLDINGQPQALYAAASIQSPFAVNRPVKSGRPEHNSFNVQLLTDKGNFVRRPHIDVEYNGLKDPVKIQISCPTRKAQIYYTTAGSEPDQRSQLYSGPFELTKSAMIKVRAFQNDKTPSRIVSQSVNIVDADFDMRLKYGPASQYKGKGELTLVDGLRGGGDIKDGRWLGFEGQNFEAVIDFGSKIEINEISIGFMKSYRSWIFPPHKIEYLVSEDGMSFSKIAELKRTIDSQSSADEILNINKRINRSHSRYLKIKAKNIGVCPEWHPGAGGKAWLFVDEVTIK